MRTTAILVVSITSLGVAVCISGCGSDAVGLDNAEKDAFPQRERSTAVLSLEAVFDAQLTLPTYYSGDTPLREVLLRESSSGRNVTYYSLQIPLDGIISMFEASGRPDHFQLALDIGENMVAAASRDRNGDGHPEWVYRLKANKDDITLIDEPLGDDSTVDPAAARRLIKESMLHDFQGAVAIVRLARVIVTQPQLNAVYGDRALILAGFVSDHIVDKWLYTYNGLNWFLNLENWSDKASMLVRMLADLSVINDDPARRRLAETLTQQFVDTTLVYDPDSRTYTWPAIAGADTAHSNREAIFIDVCAQTGIVFTDADVKRVGNTLIRRMWNGSLADPRCTNFHDGDNAAYRDRGPWEWGLIYNGWIRTGRVKNRVQSIGQAILDLALTSPLANPTVSRSNHGKAILAMSGHLARNHTLSQVAAVPDLQF